MENFNLTVGTMPYAYHMYADEDPNPKSSMEIYTNHRGYEMAMFKLAADKMKFRYKMVNPEELAWSGTINCVARVGDCDMSIGAMIISHARFQVVSHTYPFDVEAFSFATGLPRPVQDLYSILSPFTYWVWVVILIVFPLQIVCTFIVALSIEQKSTSWASLGNCVINTIGTLLGENVCNIWKQQGFALRFILGTWIICSLILTASFGGNLRAFLTKPKYEKPIDTLSDLLESGMKWDMILYGEEIEHEMASSADPIIKEVWNGKELAEFDPSGYGRVSHKYLHGTHCDECHKLINE